MSLYEINTYKKFDILFMVVLPCDKCEFTADCSTNILFVGTNPNISKTLSYIKLYKRFKTHLCVFNVNTN